MPTYADPELVAQLSQANRFFTDEDTALAAAHPFSEEIEVLTNNATESGAAQVAGRLRPMGAPGMGGWELILPGEYYEPSLGDTIGVTGEDYWDGIRDFFIRGHKVEANRGETVYALIGGPQ